MAGGLNDHRGAFWRTIGFALPGAHQRWMGEREGLMSADRRQRGERRRAQDPAGPEVGAERVGLNVLPCAVHTLSYGWRAGIGLPVLQQYRRPRRQPRLLRCL